MRQRKGHRLRNIVLFSKRGIGSIVVPSVAHKDRAFGGHLMVKPWRNWHGVSDMIFSAAANWRAFVGHHVLCAITEKAMLTVLPSLNGSLGDGRRGIVNTLEAGCWQVHDDRQRETRPGVFERTPPKDGSFKRVHTHLYGRSVHEPTSPKAERIKHGGGWGEAPIFPRFRDTPFAEEPFDSSWRGKNWQMPARFTARERAALGREIRRLSRSIDWTRLKRRELP